MNHSIIYIVHLTWVKIAAKNLPSFWLIDWYIVGWFCNSFPYQVHLILWTLAMDPCGFHEVGDGSSALCPVSSNPTGLHWDMVQRPGQIFGLFVLYLEALLNGTFDLRGFITTHQFRWMTPIKMTYTLIPWMFPSKKLHCNGMIILIHFTGLVFYCCSWSMYIYKEHWLNHKNITSIYEV